MSDPELESLKREIDLAQYARSIGYLDKPRDSMPGIVVLEHQRIGDRIAVAHCERGGIYARVPDYTPRGPGDSEEVARIRLRDAIMRSSDTGSIVEFVGSKERMAGRPEPELERVREHLAAWQHVARQLARDSERHPPDPNPLNRRMGDWSSVPPQKDPLTTSEVQARFERWREAQRVMNRKLAPASELASSSLAGSRNGELDRTARPEPALRRYDWSPSPAGSSAAHHPDPGPARRNRGGPDQGRGR